MKTIVEKKVEDAVDKTFMEKREKIEKYYKEKYPNDFKSKFKKLYDMDYTSLQKEFNRLINQLEESNIKGNKMKRSELTEFIKEEIVSVLSESTEEEVEKTKELTAATKELAKAKEEAGISEEMDDDEADTVSEGTWSSGTSNEIGRFIQDIKNLKDKYYNIVGNDDVFDGLDRAELSAKEMMIDAPENRSDLNEDDMDDDEMDKAAAKGAKREPLGKLATKMAQNSKEMKSVLSKYKKAEGSEKDKHLARLKDLTKIKKELESLLQ